MSLRDAYQQKIEAQMEEQKAKMDILKARAKRAMAEGRIIACEEIADADNKLEKMKAQLKEFAHSSGGAMKEIKGGMEKALLDLSDSCKKASTKFGNKD
jgi:hypothetical protein